MKITIERDDSDDPGVLEQPTVLEHVFQYSVSGFQRAGTGYLQFVQQVVWDPLLHLGALKAAEEATHAHMRDRERDAAAHKAQKMMMDAALQVQENRPRIALPA